MARFRDSVLQPLPSRMQADAPAPETATKALGHNRAIGDSQGSIQLGAETSGAHLARVKVGGVLARPPGDGGSDHVFKQIGETVVARRGKPLHLVLIGIRHEAQQRRDAAIEIAQRIREIELALQREAIALALPASAAAQIALPVQREDGGMIEARSIVGRSRVGRVMVQ